MYDPFKVERISDTESRIYAKCVCCGEVVDFVVSNEGLEKRAHGKFI